MNRNLTFDTLLKFSFSLDDKRLLSYNIKL